MQKIGILMSLAGKHPLFCLPRMNRFNELSAYQCVFVSLFTIILFFRSLLIDRRQYYMATQLALFSRNRIG